MALPLTFMDRELTDSVVVGPDGGVYYTLSSMSGLRGRKITTITAASGFVGIINGRRHLFVLNGVEQKWDHIRIKFGGIFSLQREWNWMRDPTLKHHQLNKELLVHIFV
ncbi:hypothetical protein B0H16DRAFT_1808880 [Mycena metata]|uniref:Uncharacterized protein n=1 Tax=Mycena metata TaxID=1033252 RepID=A0AAD7JCX7_9AGAR|nr:hypothetical protein B0H16DRAFT_1808880 [Mycena metata]